MFPKVSEAIERLKALSSGVLRELPVEKARESCGRAAEFARQASKQQIAAAGGILAAVLVFAALACGRNGAEVDPGEKGMPVYVKVRSGMTAKEIGEELKLHGVVESKYKFWLMAKLNGYENRFIAGNYALHRNMEIQQVLEKLAQGEASEYKFVIPEGFTVLDIARRLEAEGIVRQKDFLAKAKDFAPYGYMEEAEDAKYRAEGFLFPATYTVGTDAGAEEILETMAKTFDQRLTPAMRRKAREMDLSIYELVTLASLVEKEARYEEDRPIIAQVFFKRLKLGMPLQSDATLQYLMDAPKEDVSIEDTKVDSPYNTYQHKGLPPGPVANPGTDSIEAVLSPADTDYLYFVADRDGHNHYTYTYSDHLAVVEQVR